MRDQNVKEYLIEKRAFDFNDSFFLVDNVGEFIKKKLKRYPRAAKAAPIITALAAGAAFKPTYDYFKEKRKK